MSNRTGILFMMFWLSIQVLNSQNYYQVSRLDFNTHSKELAPSFYKNGLVFCSDRRSDFLMSYTDYNLNPLTNLYFSEKKKHGNFEVPRLMAKELTSALFEGPSTFSRDGRVMYFTRTIEPGNRNRNQGDTTFGIFITRYVNGQWTQPVAFEYNSAAFNTGYPFLSDDGNQLYFCSDAPGGSGGFDIYVSNLGGGKWSKPENLGDKINTSKNEVFPFFHRNGKLYFASRGLNQRGDLDIFYSVKNQGRWQAPVRLEAPFNSNDDDYGIIFSDIQDTAYFVSTRDGSADIFSAVSSLPVFSNCSSQKENDYCFVFYESNNNEIDTTTFAYEWDLGDGTTIRALEAEHCFAKPDTYLVQLNIVDKLTKDVLMSQATYTFVVEKIEQPYITASDTIITGMEVHLNGRESYLKNFNIENYYWDFGDGTRSQGIDVIHSFPVPGSYNIVLGVTGKATDSAETSSRQCVTRKIVVLDRQK